MNVTRNRKIHEDRATSTKTNAAKATKANAAADEKRKERKDAKRQRAEAGDVDDVDVDAKKKKKLGPAPACVGGFSPTENQNWPSSLWTKAVTKAFEEAASRHPIHEVALVGIALFDCAAADEGLGGRKLTFAKDDEFEVVDSSKNWWTAIDGGGDEGRFPGDCLRMVQSSRPKCVAQHVKRTTGKTLTCVQVSSRLVHWVEDEAKADAVAERQAKAADEAANPTESWFARRSQAAIVEDVASGQRPLEPSTPSKNAATSNCLLGTSGQDVTLPGRDDGQHAGPGAPRDVVAAARSALAARASRAGDGAPRTEHEDPNSPIDCDAARNADGGGTEAPNHTSTVTAPTSADGLQRLDAKVRSEAEAVLALLLAAEEDDPPRHVLDHPTGTLEAALHLQVGVESGAKTGVRRLTFTDACGRLRCVALRPNDSSDVVGHVFGMLRDQHDVARFVVRCKSRKNLRRSDVGATHSVARELEARGAHETLHLHAFERDHAVGVAFVALLTELAAVFATHEHGIPSVAVAVELLRVVHALVDGSAGIVEVPTHVNRSIGPLLKDAVRGDKASTAASNLCHRVVHVECHASGVNLGKLVVPCLSSGCVCKADECLALLPSTATATQALVPSSRHVVESLALMLLDVGFVNVQNLK